MTLVGGIELFLEIFEAVLGFLFVASTLWLIWEEVLITSIEELR